MSVYGARCVLHEKDMGGVRVGGGGRGCLHLQVLPGAVH